MTKGLATKRSELLLKEPIVPKTKNVPSRYKAMMAEQKQISASNPRSRVSKKPGRWDGVLSKISQVPKTR